ncbi:MAG: aldehyde dehydrogenase family protein, partial [Planctomycetota bacterium]
LLDGGFLEGGPAATGLRFVPAGACLGAVLPSNAPGVNGVWLPALPLKFPVLIKPGRQDPWTPFRIVQAFYEAGCPREAFGFYPTGHDGADLLLRKSGAGIVFGGAQATARYAKRPSVEIHGPGRSKVLFGPDQIEAWPELLEVCIDSILKNAGRSCINASTIVVPSRGDALADDSADDSADDIADALAARIGPLAPRPLQDPEAFLAAFPDPCVARAIDARIEDAIAAGGVRDVTEAYRDGPRLATLGGCTFLLPTVLRIDDASHPLARAELPFVFLSVLEVERSQLVRAAEDSLVVTALTQDADLIDALARSGSIDRLHTGPRPTTEIDWSQPHEGNLFELLYRRRAVAHATWGPSQ